MRESGTGSEFRNVEEENMNCISGDRLPVGFAVALILLASASFAQQGGRGSRVYDPKTAEAVKGEVLNVDEIRSPRG
jgi:hypothetical protein